MSPHKPTDRGKDGRAERLAAALKANLKRRKTQARGRAGDSRDPDDGEAAPSPGKDRPGTKDGEDR
jgi:hypothetical protein